VLLLLLLGCSLLRLLSLLLRLQLPHGALTQCLCLRTHLQGKEAATGNRGVSTPAAKARHGQSRGLPLAAHNWQ
jgi:hypothetical protein